MVPGGLLERAGELARIDGLLAAVRAGRGGVLVVTGPAGIGKTALLTEAGQRAARPGMRVLAGRGGELEGGFSFGVARQLFEPLLAGAAPAEEEALLAGAARHGLIALGDDAGATPPAAVCSSCARRSAPSPGSAARQESTSATGSPASRSAR